MTTPLQQLSQASGRAFPNLLAARELTATKLAERRPSLQQLPHDEDVAIVLMGSWGRSEVTSGSDDDYMVLVSGRSSAG
jgi:UTP:GlnB (protein PII) uridylyltransferase